MLPSILQATTVPVLEQVVNFAQARHAVLAGNIANLDTPGYRVRDLSTETFQDRLAEAIEARHASNQPVPYGVPRPDADAAMNRVKQSMEGILFHDDSNVGIEQQVSEMTKNQTAHNLAISILRSQFRLLEVAISERV